MGDPLPGGVFRRLLDLDGNLALATVREEGTVEAPKLAAEIQGEGLSAGLRERAVEQVKRMLGAGQDLSPFYRLAEKDPVMAGLTTRFYGLHSPQAASVFEALALGIVGQQIATSVARNIRARIIEAYGQRVTVDGEVHLAFPEPGVLAAAALEDLRELKLSWRKAEYIKGIASAAQSGELDRECLNALDDEEVVGRLVRLRGVGRWTAQWLLVRGLGRPNALPLGDLALRRVVSRLYFGGAPVDDAKVEEFCRPWAPWRSYAVLYWFAALRAGLE